ncbi:hypothetical protein [Floridanema evergladense]|uniref:Uncharacterized protein n=1 Tax=Floridaenema evergladense BLCC-F167 TaxID=3153639 RepID=A0ABV4WFN2_9CYAN
MDELFDTSIYVKVKHPDDIDIYPELIDSPVSSESVHPLYSSDTTGELSQAQNQSTGELYQWTETYERGNHTYVRYCYSLNRVTGSKKTVHIPGGNAHTQRTRERWVMVESLIQRGKSPEEITKIIRAWK